MAMLIDRRYNPFRDFEDIDRSFFGDNSLAEFKTDIRDIGDAYVMECDLPGFRKEDIALNLHDKVLSATAILRTPRKRAATCAASAALAAILAALM